MSALKDHLSDKNRKYCQLRSEAKRSHLACAQIVWPDMEYTTAATHSYELEKLSTVKAEIKRLCDLTETSLTLTKQETMEFLARAIRTPITELDESSDLASSITKFYDKEGKHTKSTFKVISKSEVIKINNKMAGFNEPDKIDHTHNGGVMLVNSQDATLEDWEKSAAQGQKDLKKEAEGE